ncbi:MAG: DUF5020 family protein [Pseudomonadota bacterium]
MSKRTLTFLSLLSLCAATVAQADELFKWHTTNLQLLRGSAYELGDSHRWISTFEHAHAHRFGDTYAFIDLLKPDNGTSSYYGEISPRLSLSEITGRGLSSGIVKDVLVSTTFEKAKNGRMQYLYGIAVDLAIPQFKFLKINAYNHDNTALSGDTWQVTVAWNRPFAVGSINLLIEGFADFQGSEGRSAANQLIVPRLLYDVGLASGLQANKLWLGLEYQYWRNKFGVRGITESAPQLQLKYIF